MRNFIQSLQNRKDILNETKNFCKSSHASGYKLEISLIEFARALTLLSLSAAIAANRKTCLATLSIHVDHQERDHQVYLSLNCKNSQL